MSTRSDDAMAGSSSTGLATSAGGLVVFLLACAVSTLGTGLVVAGGQSTWLTTALWAVTLVLIFAPSTVRPGGSWWRRGIGRASSIGHRLAYAAVSSGALVLAVTVGEAAAPWLLALGGAQLVYAIALTVRMSVARAG